MSHDKTGYKERKTVKRGLADVLQTAGRGVRSKITIFSDFFNGLKLKEIAPNVDAIKFRGVYLVFNDFIAVDIGAAGTKKTVRIKIPNIIPFLTLKAFTYSDEENRTAKDAYDIWYTIVNFGNGPESVKEELLNYGGNRDVKDAFKAIYHYFNNESSMGTRDVANILVKRYGLEMSFANNEIVVPIKKLKS